jgi:hypothetical protein
MNEWILILILLLRDLGKSIDTTTKQDSVYLQSVGLSWKIELYFLFFNIRATRSYGNKFKEL